MGSIDKACISGFLCRLCSEMHRIVIHIYGDQGQRLCLVEKINGYLPITISPTDALPKTICETCLRRVEQHYDLLMRLSRIKEDRFLRLNKPQQASVGINTEGLTEHPAEESEDDLYNTDEENRLEPIGTGMSASTSAAAIDQQTTSNTSRAPYLQTRVTVHNNIENSEEND